MCARQWNRINKRMNRDSKETEPRMFSFLEIPNLVLQFTNTCTCVKVFFTALNELQKGE